MRTIEGDAFARTQRAGQLLGRRQVQHEGVANPLVVVSDKLAADDDLVGMQVPARTLDQIWRRARPQLTTIMQSGIPLNAVWGKNS